jgi:alpha-1,2-mannosyltransferase
VWVVPALVLLAHRVSEGARAAWTLLGGLLVVTLAVVTALPGSDVGPIPSTGLISLQPDVYLLLYAGALAAAAGLARRPALSRAR